MERESSLSAGNFHDLYRVGQIPPKLCFFTPQCMTVKGQIWGRQQDIHIFSLQSVTIIVFDTLCFTWQCLRRKLRSSVMRHLPDLPCGTIQTQVGQTWSSARIRTANTGRKFALRTGKIILLPGSGGPEERSPHCESQPFSKLEFNLINQNKLGKITVTMFWPRAIW